MSLNGRKILWFIREQVAMQFAYSVFGIHTFISLFSTWYLLWRCVNSLGMDPFLKSSFSETKKCLRAESCKNKRTDSRDSHLWHPHAFWRIFKAEGNGAPNCAYSEQLLSLNCERRWLQTEGNRFDVRNTLETPVKKTRVGHGRSRMWLQTPKVEKDIISSSLAEGC